MFSIDKSPYSTKVTFLHDDTGSVCILPHNCLCAQYSHTVL